MFSLESFQIFIGCVFVAIFFIICGRKILRFPFKISLVNIITGIGLVFVIFLSRIFLDNGFKVIAIYLGMILLNKIVYKKSFIQCSVAALVSYLLLSLGEILIVVLISIASKLNIINNTDFLKDNIIVNLLISLGGYLSLLLTYKKIRKLISDIKNNNIFTYIFAFSLLLIGICSLFYSFFFNDYKIDSAFIINLLLIFSISYIAIVMIKQMYDKNKIMSEYERYVTYSKQSEKLVEQFSISQHENKNELIIIRSMVHKTNKKLLEYLDEIISNKDNIDNSWIRYLRYIPFGGLKGIIHNKISEMKENNLIVFLNISSDIGKSNLKKLTIKENDQLTKIIGVFLDNANEAAIITKEKQVSISIFLEDKNVVFEISNSCNKDVKISDVYEPGITTKGSGRGYGLYLVKNIIDSSNKFYNETKFVEGYFVQILKVLDKK